MLAFSFLSLLLSYLFYAVCQFGRSGYTGTLARRREKKRGDGR